MASVLRQGGGKWGHVQSQINLYFNPSLFYNLLSISMTNPGLQLLLKTQYEALQGIRVEGRDRSPW